MSGGPSSSRDDGFANVTPAQPRTPADPGASGGNERGGGGGGGGGGEPDVCDRVQRAPLNSPKPAVVARLGVADVLEVVLDETGGRPILEVRWQGTAAGALTHRGHVEIIRCIQRGRTYRAVVLSKMGGAVELRIEPA